MKPHMFSNWTDRGGVGGFIVRAHWNPHCSKQDNVTSHPPPPPCSEVHKKNICTGAYDHDVTPQPRRFRHWWVNVWFLVVWIKASAKSSKYKCKFYVVLVCFSEHLDELHQVCDPGSFTTNLRSPPSSHSSLLALDPRGKGGGRGDFSATASLIPSELWLIIQGECWLMDWN